jgi:hypothetical protein
MDSGPVPEKFGLMGGSCLEPGWVREMRQWSGVGGKRIGERKCGHVNVVAGMD